ncbi:hypothetical protein [Bradyrhizobium sp.]|nr:hypothetical protein [Bradyrhizobium sp.]
MPGTRARERLVDGGAMDDGRVVRFEQFTDSRLVVEAALKP